MIRSHIPRLTKFGAVGIVNTAVDLVIFFTCIRLFDAPLVLANGSAFIFAVTVSYLLNTQWTFQEKRRFHSLSFKRYIRFTIANLSGFVIATLTLILLAKILPLLLAKLLSIATSVLVNYSLSYLYVYRKQ